MKLAVKDMDIATGGIIIAVLNEKDAAELDLHPEDRIRIKKGKKGITAIIDIAESKKAVPPKKIGLFEESLDLLKAKNNDKVAITLEEKPKSVQYIRKKLNRKKLNYAEFGEITRDIVNNKLSHIELTHFVAACYTQGLSMKETVALTKAMVDSGKRMKLAGKIMDLHCIGGVPGNRTTMIIVPIIAASGLKIPKTSSRAITSPAGTADTMETLAKVDLSFTKMRHVIEKVNGCIVWGGAISLAPADDKIIRIEYPLSIDAEGQLIASVMSKKYSVSSKYLLIDIPVGKTTKAKTKKDAARLKQKFEKIGKQLGIKVKVITTNGSQPIGNGIGPVLEAKDCLAVLKNSKKMPLDLKEKSVMMAGLLLEMGGKAKKGKGKEKALAILESGLAHKKMMQIIKAQGKMKTPQLGKETYDYRANKNGKIVEMDNEDIAKIARLAGAPKDTGAGLYLYKHVSDKAKKGEKIFTIYAESKAKLKHAKKFLKEKDGIKIQ